MQTRSFSLQKALALFLTFGVLGLSSHSSRADDDLLFLVPVIVSEKDTTTRPPSPPTPPTTPGDNQRPGPDNTGPTGTLLEVSGSIKASVNGEVIENMDIDGCITIDADNVIVRNVKVDCGGFYAIRVNSGVENALIEDVELLNMRSAGILGSNFTLRRANIHDSGGDALKPGSNVVVENSWFHRLGTIEGSHSDGIQMVSGSQVQVSGNYFDMPDVDGFTNSQCILLQTNNGPISDITIENNWLNGGGWCVQVNDKGNGHGSPQKILIKDNRFGPDCQFGTILVRGDNADTTLLNNVFEATGQIIGESIDSNVCGNDL